jgi:hypothetical protein|tara:strand:- start:416 stop:676 length:261 start_codon:yes stop_codon:yes gene_type:complete
MNNFNDELDLESGVYATRTRNRGRYHREDDDKPYVVQVKSRYSSLKNWKDMLVAGLITSDESPNSQIYNKSWYESCHESCVKCVIS